MITLTLAVIAKHGTRGFQALAEQALSHCRQIVVAVDDNSEDGIWGFRSDQIEYFRRPLQGHFAAQRNFLIEQAKGDWILCLDTDENIGPWLWQYLPVILEATVEDLIMLPRRTVYIGHPEIKTDWPDWQPKLHRRTPTLRWHLPVHEWPVHYNGKRFFPENERFAIQHVKTIEDQERANQLYARIEKTNGKTA